MSRYGSKYKSKSILDRSQSSLTDADITIPVTVGSVVDVLSNTLSSDSDKYTESIGNIIVAIKKEDGSFKNEVASPMSPHFISLPLPNERVSLMQDSISNKWYYLTALSRSGFVNHMGNAFKRVFKKDSNELHVGKTFTPRPALRSLNIYEGDTLFQGRNGQSIRFGSKQERTNTPWSETGDEGLPIITIRNGVSDIENLEVDFSSIYLTSGQTLPIEFSNKLPDSITELDEYDDNQIVITSNRLTLYSKEDSIVLASNNDIGLVTSTWALDISILADQVLELSEHVITLADEVSKHARHSSQITVMSTPPGSPTSPPNNLSNFTSVSTAASTIKSKVEQIQKNIDNMKQ